MACKLLLGQFEPRGLRVPESRGEQQRCSGLDLFVVLTTAEWCTLGS